MAICQYTLFTLADLLYKRYDIKIYTHTYHKLLQNAV